MITLRTDPHEAVREPIRLPPLLSSFASLSLLGHFMMLSRPRPIYRKGFNSWLCWDGWRTEWNGPSWKKVLRPLLRRS